MLSTHPHPQILAKPHAPTNRENETPPLDTFFKIQGGGTRHKCPFIKYATLPLARSQYPYQFGDNLAIAIIRRIDYDRFIIGIDWRQHYTVVSP